MATPCAPLLVQPINTRASFRLSEPLFQGEMAVVQIQRNKNRRYRAGDSPAISGIYKVTHLAHRGAHEVMVIAGEELPACRTCKNQVRFLLVRPVTHVTHDWDLT